MEDQRISRTRYQVMRQDPESRRMVSASGGYDLAASAFKFAKEIAHHWPGLQVTVWEYRGPRDSTIHVVQTEDER